MARHGANGVLLVLRLARWGDRSDERATGVRVFVLCFSGRLIRAFENSWQDYGEKLGFEAFHSRQIIHYTVLTTLVYFVLHHACSPLSIPCSERPKAEIPIFSRRLL